MEIIQKLDILIELFRERNEILKSAKEVVVQHDDTRRVTKM